MSEENFSRIKKILAAIDDHKGKTEGTQEWKQANDQLDAALNNFQFKYNLEEIKEISDRAEKVNLLLDRDFVFGILDRCPAGILDSEAALDLMKHCDYEILNDNFDEFLKKVDLNDQDEVSQIQAIFAAINAYDDVIFEDEQIQADDQLEAALNNFRFKYRLKEIKGILECEEKVNFKLSRDFVFKILNQCSAGILDSEAAFDLMKHCDYEIIGNDFDEFLKKVDLNDQDEVMQIQAIFAAINAHKGKSERTQEWEQADDQLRLALNNFQCKYSLKEINGILKRAEEVKLKLNSNIVSCILKECPEGTLDSEAALDLMKYCDYEIIGNDFDEFLKKVDLNDQDEVKQIQAIFAAIIAYANATTGNEKNQASKQPYDALNNFQFKYTFKEIKGILECVEEAGYRLGLDYTRRIFDRCLAEILDSEAALDLMRHCNYKIFDDDFEKFLKKVNTYYREKVEQIQAIFAAIDANKKGTEEAKDQLMAALNNFQFEYSLKEIKGILEQIKTANFHLDKDLTSKIFDQCQDGILDEETCKEVGKSDVSGYLDLIYYDENPNLLLRKLDKTAQDKLIIEPQKRKNKKLGILGSGGVTVGGLFGLIAIGLGVAVGIGVLTVTIAAPIALAVVGSVLMGIFGYVIDKFRVDKELNKIEEAKLTKPEYEYDKKEIPFDLRKRKKIKDALNELLIGNNEDTR